MTLKKTLLPQCRLLMMDLSLIEWVAIVYVSLNAAITLFVSILGVKYVRDEIKRRKGMMQSPRAQPNIVMSAGSSANIDDPIASTSPPDEVRCIVY